MPKIRLSALVSDIKGKSNGSVFSKNNGGIYFRNNPNGGGRKSAKWDKQKSVLSSLSTEWKSLTNEQQEAWNAATTSYPTTDAFGNIRIPSGYQLFMRLNGTLRSMGLPMLAVPNSPRTTPSPGTISIDYPDLWQLNPRAAVRLFNPADLTANMNLIAFNLLSPTSLLSPRTIAFRVAPTPQQFLPVTETQIFQIFTFLDANNHGLYFTFESVSNESAILQVMFFTPDGVWRSKVTVAKNIFRNPTHIALTITGPSFTDIAIYIDGVSASITTSFTGEPADFSGEWQQKFPYSDPDYKLCSVISDYRLYDSTLSAENVLLVSQGYVLDSELCILDFIGYSGSQFTNYGSLGSDYNFLLTGSFPIASTVIPYSFFLIPAMSVLFENEGLSGLVANIYGSPPTSNGKTGSFSNYKKLGSYEWETETVFSIYEELRAVYSNIPPGSQVIISVDIIDTTTGAAVDKKKKAGRKDLRFKAGTDLATKVN